MDLTGMKRRELQALCKRHGLPAGGTNADLVARLDAVLSGPADVDEEVAGVPARKGCLKQTGGDAAEAKKVTFVVEEGKARRLRSRVIWSPVVAKTRGKSARAGTDFAAEDGVSAEVGADVPVRRSRRNSVSAAEAEEVGEAVAVDRKRKRKNQDNDEGVAVSSQVGVSSRVTRRSALAGAAAVLPPAVEKKRGRRNAAESDVQKSALVEVSARTTRSRSIALVVMPPTVAENKRRKTGDAQTTVELPIISDVPRNDVPATRSLRNKVVTVNNSVVDETHTTRQLENKMRPSTRRHQQVASSLEDKDQEKTAAPSKAHLLRRSQRNYSEANSANSETIKLAKDSNTAQPLARHNAHSEDLEKQPAVKEALKRSTRKSIVLATLEKEEKDVIEEKNPEAHVRRSVRKSVVLVKDFKGIVEEIQYANSEDVAKQPATKGSVRGSRRKSVISELHEKEKGLIAEKNMETDEGRLMRKPVMPVKNIKAVGEGIQIAKGKDVDKQFVVKQPTRRSSRKSVLPDMLENNSGLLSPKMNAEMNVRRSTRKSVLPDMLNEEKQDHRKMARNENLQSGKYQDGEKQQKAKDPIGQSRRSVATVLLEERNNDEEKKSKNPTRTSTHKSVALNAVEEVSMDHIEVGEEGLKLRKHRRFLLEISSSANDSWKHQNAQISNEKDNTEGRQQASNCTTSKGRSSKRRRTTASEEVTPFKVANDDIIIMEETKDTHEYNKESNSKVQENFQVNATREGFSSGPLLVTVAPSDEICTVQSVHVVIPGSESGDNANESSDKSKQPQEHSHTQAVDDHLSETRTGKLDRSTCIAGLVLDNCEVSEDKTLMSEDEDAQPSGCVAGKKHDVDQGVAEEVLAQEKCNYQHVPAKTDLEMKLNDELAGPGMESGCSTTEKNEMLVADNLDQEGDLEKPSLCSATPECKQECGLPEETVFPSKKTGSLLCVEQSLFGLKSLFSQESIVESVGHSALASATTHTENGFDDSKDCHIKSALESVYVSEPFSHHDTKGGIFKNVDCMHTSQQDNGMEGLPEANPDEERVLSAFLLDAKHLKAVINSEVVSEGEGSKELLHSEDGKASSEKTDVNDGNGYGISDAVVRCALHAPADDNYEICLGFNTDVPRQVYNDRCSDVKEERLAPKSWTTDIIEGASAKCIESGDVLPDKERSNLKDWQLDSKLEGTEIVESGLYFNKDIGNILDSGSIGEITPSGSGLSKDSSVEYIEEVLDGFSMEASLDRSSTRGEQNGCSVDAIENPSVSLQTPGYKHEGALSEEAVCTKKNYAGTCLSNPRELIMELQSHFSKENIKESDPDDSLVFTTAENSADEQRVEVHHGSNLSQLGSTDLLDEPIGCSNTDVLCQCHNHQNQSNEDRVEEFEAAAAANYIESEVVLLPSEERSNLNEEQLNPKLESPNIMGSGLNCDKDVCNTSHNKSVFAIGNRTPSASGLLGDYRKDSDLQQELLDRFSVESSFQGNIFGKKTVSGVAGSEIPSLSLATPDYKHEDAFSEEAVCRTKNYTGMSSVDPRHLLMEVHSVYSEGSTEKSNLQDNLAFPSAESGKDEPIICHVEKLVDAHASSEPDTYQGPCNDLSRHEEKESCMSIPMQAKESGGFLRSSHTKGSVTAAQIDLAGDTNLIESDNAAAKQVFCEEKEETKSMPTSDIDILHEKSYSSGHDEQAACASETQFYHSQKASICDGLHLGPSSLQLESLDALDNDILYVNTGVLDQHHKEGYYEHNVYEITSDICTMSETEPFEVLETEKDVKTPSQSDGQLDPELDGDEAEKQSLNYVTGSNRILGTGSVMSKRALSLPGSGPWQQCVNKSTSTQATDNIEVLNQDHEEYNQNNEDQIIPGILASTVPEAVEVEMEHAEIEIGLAPASETLVLPVPDEQPKSKLEGDERQTTPGIRASSVPEAVEVEMEQSEIEIGLVPASETSVLPLQDEQPNSKLESDENQITPGIQAGTVPEAVEVEMEQSEIEIGLVPASETSVLPVPDEQPNSKLEGDENQITPGIRAGSVPEAVEVEMEQSEIEIGLVPALETSVLPVQDEQPNSKLESDENQITPGIRASSVPEAVEVEMEHAEIEIGLVLASETSVLPVPDEQPNTLEGDENQTTPGIRASSVPEALEIEQSETEIALMPAAETSVLLVPDEQRKLEGDEVDEYSCSHDKDLPILFDSELLKREASSLHKDDCMDLSSEDNHPNDIPAPRSPEQSACFQNDNDLGSVGICQGSRRRGIDELCGKLQRFKVSSAVKRSYVAMSAPRPKPGDSMSRSAAALLRNIENTTAVKAGRPPVKPNADGKDSSRRALQPISGRPREH